MIFNPSCKLNASPGPMPGAPFQSPMVSAVTPSPLPALQTRSLWRGEVEGPTVPQPLLGGARFFLLNRLKNSIRNCAFTLSVIFVFLITEKSVEAYPGPYRKFLGSVP